MKAPADPARKVSLCPPSSVLTPRSVPAVSPLPASPPGVRQVLLGPWHSGRRLPLPPLILFLLLLLFQGRLGASRRKSRPSPLPPAGSGAEGPSRQRSRTVSQCLRPRPDPRQAPPPLSGPDRGRWPGQRMRPGEAAWVGPRVRAAASWLWSPGRPGALEFRSNGEIPCL